jgi:hypothetical protein
MNMGYLGGTWDGGSCDAYWGSRQYTFVNNDVPLGDCNWDYPFYDRITYSGGTWTLHVDAPFYNGVDYTKVGGDCPDGVYSYDGGVPVPSTCGGGGDPSTCDWPSTVTVL